MAARCVCLFDNEKNFSSSGAQDKQSSNYAVGQQWPVLGKVPASGVWLKLKLVYHLGEPSTLWNSVKSTQFLQNNTRIGD